ncbi:ABC transporter ATP-binding protein [Gracilibacillus saliphilus]|uniref:ABC transporter ATP-binding protein n=1 Tax=Gracilibacillus saliphilus TaxID=543890 RepID=UPI0013D4EEE2|nr:ABC transporter ATP-binding protein [Gracilibacillus saliphilus]
MNQDTILDINDLRTSFLVDGFEVKAVDGVSFKLPKGKTIGIVGESGSGKSITAMSILQLLDKPGKIMGGEINFKGRDLTKLSEKEIRNIRGNEISMIFQEPMTSLNPVYTIGQQIRETLKVHQGLDKQRGTKKAIELLTLVGIPSPEQRVKQYPHELSGGMRQRVMIAMALACNPELLIADEPTTALDVTIQAQILELIKNLQSELGMSVIMITHDMGVVAETCDYVAVMYGGKVVEYQDVKSIFKSPKHPYTVGLLNSIPRHDTDVDELEPIKGNVPSPKDMPDGCRFAPRCPFATELCTQELPTLDTQADGGEVRCWIYTDRWDGDPEVNVRESKRTAQSE